MSTNTTVKILGKIGKPKFSVQLVITDEELAKLSVSGLGVAKNRAGEPKSLAQIGLEGNVIKGERLVSKGKIAVSDLKGGDIEGLIGYGSDVELTGFVSTFTNTYGTFSKLYIDKITVHNLVEVASNTDEAPAASNGVI
jgi:hypothetical protein